MLKGIKIYRDGKKRLFMFFLIVIIMFTLSYAESIKVIHPQSGDIWLKGHIYSINWQRGNNKLSNFVKITLFNVKKRMTEAIIAKEVSNTGTYKWQIPNEIPSGSYIITVSTVGSLTSWKSPVFSIKQLNVLDLCKIVLKSPEKGSVYCKGDTVPIRWNSLNSKFCRFNTSTVNLKILILNDSHVCNYSFYNVPALERTISNSGYYNWTISPMLFGGLYRVKLTKSNKVYYSNCFKVLAHCFLSDTVLNKIKNHSFSPVQVKMQKNTFIKTKANVYLKEIVDFLKPIHHGNFDIILTSSRNSVTLLKIFHSSVSWFVNHTGETALVDNSFFAINSRLSGYYVEIFDNESGEKLKRISIKIRYN